jgi:hypothetical protein
MPKVQVDAECVQVQAKPRRWRFTVERYQRMGEAGIFQKEDRVEVYRQPRGRSYDEITMRHRGEHVSALAFPEIAIPVQDLLG